METRLKRCEDVLMTDRLFRLLAWCENKQGSVRMETRRRRGSRRRRCIERRARRRCFSAFWPHLWSG